MFQGFDERTIDFLWGIRLNNNREWFLNHKQEYLDYLYQPMKELAGQVYQATDKKFPRHQFFCKVTRIYRDVRRIHWGGPYKEHLWFSLSRVSEDWRDTPGLYFEVMPEGYEYGLYYSGKPVMMEAYRKEVLRSPKKLERLAAVLAKRPEYAIEGEEYKRPKGETSPLLTPWFNRKSIAISARYGPDELFTSPALADKLIEEFAFLEPYYSYFSKIKPEAGS